MTCRKIIKKRRSQFDIEFTEQNADSENVIDFR